MEKKITKENLAEVLEEMAAYVESEGIDEFTEGYFEEITKTGLFHDAVGKIVARENGSVTVVTEY